jgi:hypothetical protein
METLTGLLASGDTGCLILAVVSFHLPGLLTALAVRVRPRSRRRLAR